MNHEIKLLLGSGGYRTKQRLDLWKEHADDFLKDVQEVLFIPYAGFDEDAYVQKIHEMDFHVGRKTVGIHTFSDPHAAIDQARAIHIGGGNTFRLLHRLQQEGLLDHIIKAVQNGALYLGISAGSNVACPTIQTTNDMPIVMPSDLVALGLVSFQINAHYFAGKFQVQERGQWVLYEGESREDRLREFHQMNSTPVLALPEGTHITVENDQMVYFGHTPATLFRPNQPMQTINDRQSLSLDLQ